MGYLHHHVWATEGPDVYCCVHCGIYRCYAYREPMVPFRMGSPVPPQRIVEYSMPDGEIIAIDPKYAPECEPMKESEDE